MKVLSIVLALACIGCDAVVQRTTLNIEPVKTRQSCNYTGFCWACAPGIGFDGKMDLQCRFQITPFCQGSRPATGTRVTERLRYESGKVEIASHITGVRAVPGSDCQ